MVKTLTLWYLCDIIRLKSSTTDPTGRSQGRRGSRCRSLVTAMIRFDVSTLIRSRLGSTLTFTMNTGPQRLTDLDVDFLRGTIRVTRVQAGLLVQGEVETQLRLDCVRCLDAFSLPTVLEIEETFRLPASKPKPDLPYAVGEDGWMDLAPVLREQAWVAIPIKPVCRSECQGLCPECGANLNAGPCDCGQGEVDPRWASLKDLL